MASGLWESSRNGKEEAKVFVVSGIWHGAGWNFVAWGALHGAFLIGNRLTLEWLSIRKRDQPYELLRHPAVLVVLVCLMVLLTPGRNNAFIYFAF